MPSSPTKGLIFGYESILGVNQPGSPNSGKLLKTVLLNKQKAIILANSLRNISLKVPSGVYLCPLDIGSVILIGFSYNGRTVVGLCYNNGGCQTLDNGRLGTFEVGNLSFYSGFETVFNKLFPPINNSALSSNSA